MVFELSVLGVAFVAMAAILWHKHLEGSRGANTSVSAVREKADPVLHSVRASSSRFLSYFTLKNGVLLANYVFVHVVRFLMHFSHKVHKVSSDVVHKASKKKEDLTRGGAASFYLKKIKEDKKGAGEGKIEEGIEKKATQ